MSRVVFLQLYRLAILCAIVWIVRVHHARLRIEGDKPVALAEAQRWFTNAAELKLDVSARGGLHVLGTNGDALGYLVRTLPEAGHIIGYCGISDALVALDREGRVFGFRIRGSEDTRQHVADVNDDRFFRKTWNGMTWEQVAGMNLKQAGVEGVSGATMTSMAVAEGIVQRFRAAQSGLQPPPMRFSGRDAGLACVLVAGLWLTFTKREGRHRWRQWFQWIVIGYVGFVNGDLLAQSLFAGWAKSGIGWRMAPGLALLAGAALVVPWIAKRPVYCHQICPHGAAQEIIGRLVPRRWRVQLPASLDRGLRWLPGLLLAFVLIVVMLPLDFELAGLEPFDAYIFRTAGVATIAVAVAGLIAAAFVPKAYCKYGCPTGALLEFGRSHGVSDRFSKRDVAALLLVLLALVMSWQHAVIHQFIYGPAI